MADYQTDIYHKAALALGWTWSSAHHGYISESHRDRPGEDRNSFGSYVVAEDGEGACFRDGVENIEQALNLLKLR